MATNVKRKKKAEVMADDGNMTLTGHLKELRNRLIVCAVVFVVAVVVTLSYADRLIDLLTAMGQGFYTFVSIAPQEKLMQYFRVSLLAAVVVTVPVALYQVYAFAKPGLKKSETFFLKLVILLGLALFVVGVMFAYKLMMPFMLQFLSTGIEGADYIQTTTSIESYVSLCLTMFIIFGCVFEMPLVTIILAKMGIANPQLMKKGRGIAIVLIFFVAAVVPAGHRFPVHGSHPDGPALLCQHLPERHLLQAPHGGRRGRGRGRRGLRLLKTKMRQAAPLRGSLSHFLLSAETERPPHRSTTLPTSPGTAGTGPSRTASASRRTTNSTGWPAAKAGR